MSISKASSAINAGIIILTCLVGYFVFQLYYAIQNNLDLARNKEIAVQLAGELMESSKQLTSNVRQYAATGDSRYEKIYFGIVDERAGKTPRAASREVAPGRKIALTDLMRQYGVTTDEFALVEKGNQLSDALIALETEAMNAVKGIYKDAKGDYTVKGEPDMDRARELVFGPAYNAETEKIMAPLNEFFAALEKRTSAQVAASIERVDHNGLFLCFALALTLLLSLISAVYARRGICRPLERLSDFAQKVMAGDYASRIETHSNNEIGTLSRALDAMLDKLESQNKHLTEQQQMIQQMERQRVQQARIAELQAGWDREAEQLKAQYPDFNMAEVLANPEVEKMMRSGVSVTNAYRSAYFDHILKQQQAATARQVEQGVVNRMQQRNARPGENGTRPGGAVQTKIDVSHMSRKEMEEMEKRVMRGEVITL